jgi:ankyrin repeat protein
MTDALMELLRAIASRDEQEVLRMLDASLADHPGLARQAAEVGATRQASTAYYFEAIEHYVYAGDTALHIAASAHAPEIATMLLSRGASVSARNRRGAEPLHYAADGIPGSPAWNPEAQEAVIQRLLEAGADPNAADKSGVTPLHRAVRTRCATAVRRLLAGGADPRRRNGSGSTPLHLAVQNTGRGSAGSPAAREQQKEIIALLLKHGARPADRNAAGRSVTESATDDWILDLLGTS